MEWAIAVTAAFDASERVFMGLREQQTSAKSSEAREATVQIEQLQSTLITIQYDCESKFPKASSASPRISNLKKRFHLLKDFLSKRMQWLVRTIDDSPVASVDGYNTFLFSLQHIKHIALVTLGRWQGDKQELHLPDLFSFLQSFQNPDTLTFSNNAKLTSQTILCDQLAKTLGKRVPNTTLNLQQPPKKKRCQTKNVLKPTAEYCNAVSQLKRHHSTAENLRGPQARAMTDRLTQETPSGVVATGEMPPTPPDSLDETTSARGARIEEQYRVQSRIDEEVERRFDRLSKQQNQLLRDIERLEREMDRGLASF